MLNIALPKGRLGDQVYSMLRDAGYDCPLMRIRTGSWFWKARKKVSAIYW